MTKYIEVKFTEDQARLAYDAIEYHKQDNPIAAEKAMCARIMSKIWNAIHASYGSKS